MKSATTKLFCMLAVSALILSSTGWTAFDGSTATAATVLDAPSAPPGGGGSSAPTSWSADKTYTSSDNNSESSAYSPSVASSASDTNAILNNGGTVWLKDITASRTGSSSSGGDSASFYGIGATVLTVDGTSYIDGATLNSTDAGGAGIFAYNTGKTYVRNATINTKGNTAGGIHAAGGGTLYAYNVNATSAGTSSAALRSDRGGGTMVVEGGSYTSNGKRSPAVYCTADITVADAALTATASEGICIEGLNSLALWNCDLKGDAPAETENSNLTWGIILYQSMSGDSSVGNSEFYMENGSIDCTARGTSSTLFFNTNTESTITLNNVDINTDYDFDYFLLVSGFSRWGKTGSNGADCIFTGIGQEISGNIGWDSISEVDFYLTDGSVLTGAVINDNTFGQTSSGSGYCNVYIDSASKWICTGNSTVTNLYNAGAITDASGNTVSIIAGGTKVVSGTSAYTITVTGSYSTTANMSGKTSAGSYSYTPYASWNPWSDGGAVTTTVSTASQSTSTSTTTVSTANTSSSEFSSTVTTVTSNDGPPDKPDETGTSGSGGTPPVKPSDVKGDVNNDGTLTVADAVLLQKYLLTYDVEIPMWRAADMDNNNRLNASDLTLLKREMLNS